MSTDSEIIVRSLTRPEVFADLFERHARTVNAFATYRVGRDAAEDVLSETFLVAFRRRADFDLSSDSAAPWLLGIASRLIRRHRAVEAKHWQSFVAPAPPADNSSLGGLGEAMSRVDERRDAATVKDRIAGLAPKDRETLVLAAWQGLSQEEIAVALGIPVGTVRSRMNRVRRRLAPARRMPEAEEPERRGAPADMRQRVAELRPDVDGVDENLAVARDRLASEIGAESRIPMTRSVRRPWIIIGGLGGAAAAVTAGVLTLNALTAAPSYVGAVPTRTPGTTIESAPAPSPMPPISTGTDALRVAAVAAVQSTAPVLAPGQYRRHAWTVEQLLLYDPAPDSDGWSVPGDGRDRTTATGGWVVTRSGARYSSADPHSAWYEEIGPTSLIGALGDGAANQARLDPMLQASAQGVPLRPMGGVPALDDGDGHAFLWYFDAMPREPRAMIDWVIQYFGLEQQGWVEGAAGWVLITLLAFNEGDPAMRSAVYQALSLLPGSTVGSEVDGMRTVTFDSNLAGSDPVGSSSTRFTLSIEMSTGLVTETTTTSGVGMVMIPDGIPDIRTSYTTSVVDDLP